MTDGIATTAQTLTVTVQGRNDSPITTADTINIDYQTPLVITSAMLLGNDTDLDGDVLYIAAVNSGVGGTVELQSNGNLLFTPDAGFKGLGSFEYTASDGHGGTTTESVTVDVGALPVPETGPVASLVTSERTVVAKIGVGIDFVFDQGRVATLADGGYVAVWWTAENNSSDVFARRYKADGTPAGDAFLVNTVAANNQGGAAVTALPDGGFVIAWHSVAGQWMSATSGTIQQQRYDSNGVKLGAEQTVNSYTGTSLKRFPSLTTLNDGGWVVAWGSNTQPGDPDWGNYAQRYDAQGQKVGGETHLNSYTTGPQANVIVAALVDGGWVATWTSYAQDGSANGVYLQRFTAANQPVGGEIRANVTTAGDQLYVSATGLADGGWVSVWASNLQDGSGYGAYARVFNADGTARTGEVQLNQITAGDQYQISVQGLADGSFMTAWSSYDAAGYAVKGRRIDAQGLPLGGEVELSDGRIPNAGTIYGQNPHPYQAPSLTARTDGGFTVSWREPSGTDTAIITRTFAASDEAPVVTATSGAIGQGTVLHGAALVRTSHIQGERWVAGGLQQLTHYQFVDNTAGEASGYFTVNGIRQDTNASFLISADDLGSVQWHAGTGIGTDHIQLRGFDGRHWSDWAGGTMTTLPKSSSVAVGPINQVGRIGVGIDFVFDQGRVATLADGGYVAVWWTAENNSSDVFARRYKADGTPAGDAFLVNTVAANNQGGAAVTALPDGGFVIAWHSVAGQWMSATSGTIQQQRYDSNGVKLGAEQTVNSYTGTSLKRFPSLTTLNDGGWVVAWGSNTQPGDPDWGNYAQRYDAQGQKVGGETHLNSYTTGPQANVIVAALVDGGWVATWTSYAQDGSANGVYLQRFTAANQPVGGEIRANVTTAGDQLYVSATGLADGGWVSVWASNLQDGSGYGAYARVFNADGTARTGEVQLNQITAGDQYQISVQGLADGSFMTAWSSYDAAGYAVKGRRIDAQGLPLGGEVELSDGRIPNAGTIYGQNPHPYQAPSLTARTDGGFTVSWREPSGTDTAIITRTFAASTTDIHFYVGTPINDTLFGSSGSDTLTGGLGADLFSFSLGGSQDTITDFDAAQGDRIGLATGLTYSVDTNANGDAVIVYGTSDIVTLVGVQPAAVSSAWFVTL